MEDPSMSDKYIVGNMKCDGCVSTVKGALDDLPGSNAVSVDLTSGIVEINSGVDPKEVEKDLVALGYPAKKIP
jgi:copper chaperone CopZ